MHIALDASVFVLDCPGSTCLGKVGAAYSAMHGSFLRFQELSFPALDPAPAWVKRGCMAEPSDRTVKKGFPRFEGPDAELHGANAALCLSERRSVYRHIRRRFCPVKEGHAR